MVLAKDHVVFSYGAGHLNVKRCTSKVNYELVHRIILEHTFSRVFLRALVSSDTFQAL